MVWFQCEDCGENLKKPKLLIHFNRCSAYKLSCIDCGVVFDQQSVHAHSSCVSEAEKYGPKGLSKGVTGPASKLKDGKVPKGLNVDFSRGLSSFPPWSCSLCNVKATSQETLEIHGHGKKHQGKVKAAAAKERSETDGGDIGVYAGPNFAAIKHEPTGTEMKDGLATTTLDFVVSSARKKRKKERIADGGVHAPLPSGNLEKKLKLGPMKTEDESLLDHGKDKKRKLVEENQETASEKAGNLTCMKRRKKSKQVSGKKNGHEEVEMREPRVSEVSGAVGKDENGEQVQLKEKGSRKDFTRSPLGSSGFDGIWGACFERGAEFERGRVDGKNNSDKKTKKPKGPLHVDVSKRSDLSGIVQHEENVFESNKREKKKRSKEQKESIVHEVSFREWLREDYGIHSGTPTHPPHDIYRGRGNLEWPDVVEKSKPSESSQTNSTQESITKVVKWKKIIGDILGKSLNGKLKKKDLKRAVVPLAQKAMESASISVDKRALKAELMRQVSSSPQFVVDGKHVMLSS